MQSDQETSLTINIDDLNEVITTLLSKLKNIVGNEIVLRNDFYWKVDAPERYDPYREPESISLGQLSFDLDIIKERKHDPDNLLAYHFGTVSSILEALSDDDRLMLL